ncbi:hypothetical protein PF010_g19410 [Phytophthora fragariae]|uniref:Uncharacterized protein n=1 Tax=Phytophthora fragariae TaxID=53985 RepID=A0A6G0KH95_9STRA|nr:hypothetical protein PF010_g19410 [Phytophthora fragariae]
MSTELFGGAYTEKWGETTHATKISSWAKQLRTPGPSPPRKKTRTQGKPDVQARPKKGRKAAGQVTRGRVNYLDIQHVDAAAHPGHAEGQARADAAAHPRHVEDPAPLVPDKSKPDTPTQLPVVMSYPQSRDTSESKPTASQGNHSTRSQAGPDARTDHAAHAELEEDDDANAETQPHFGQARWPVRSGRQEHLRTRSAAEEVNQAAGQVQVLVCRRQK